MNGCREKLDIFLKFLFRASVQCCTLTLKLLRLKTNPVLGKKSARTKFDNYNFVLRVVKIIVTMNDVKSKYRVHNYQRLPED